MASPLRERAKKMMSFLSIYMLKTLTDVMGHWVNNEKLYVMNAKELLNLKWDLEVSRSTLSAS